MSHPRRAFTMLELVIGMTMSLAIAGVAMGTLLSVQQTQKESMLKNAATRDGMYMLDMVGGDLGYAGVGVPRGVEADIARAPGDERLLRPIIRVGSAQTIAFIGDLPLPNSDLNGLAQLADIGPTNTTIAISSEIALCPPSAAASFHCDTRKNTLLALPAGALDCSSDATATTCPWAQGKWARTSGGAFVGQLLLLTTPNGRWAWRRVALDANDRPAVVTVNDVRGFAVVDDFPGGNPGDGALTRQTYLAPAIGATTIATLDRVFYSAQKLSGGTCDASAHECVLMRRHCWGEVLDPRSPGFPAPGSPEVTPAVTPAGCSVPGEGTAWEPVANNLDSFRFRYFDINDVELPVPLSVPDLSKVASVAVELVILRKTGADTNAPTVSHRVDRRYFLDSGDGYGPNGRR